MQFFFQGVKVSGSSSNLSVLCNSTECGFLLILFEREVTTLKSGLVKNPRTVISS